LFADGGLGDVEPAGGSAEAAVFCGGDEVTKVAQLHSIMISVFPIDGAGKNYATIVRPKNQYRSWKIFPASE
jgi:hypothetical protein